MGKIVSLKDVHEAVKKSKRIGKTTGLITGCFDIVHIGHIELFRFAKQHVDIVFVGLDNDEAIRLSKGVNRPINTLTHRCLLLSEFRSIDYIFPIDIVAKHTVQNSHFYDEIAKKVSPDYIITSPIADKFWQEKKRRAEQIGAEFLAIDTQKSNSTTAIVQKLHREL